MDAARQSQGLSAQILQKQATEEAHRAISARRPVRVIQFSTRV
jgi:hypothetical protein